MPRGEPVLDDLCDTVAVYIAKCGHRGLGESIQDIAQKLKGNRTARALNMRVDNAAAAMGMRTRFDGRPLTYDHYADRTKRVADRLGNVPCDEILKQASKALER